jgi:hypothetical protein
MTRPGFEPGPPRWEEGGFGEHGNEPEGLIEKLFLG